MDDVNITDDVIGISFSESSDGRACDVRDRVVIDQVHAESPAAR